MLFFVSNFFSALIICSDAASISLVGDAIQCPPTTSPTNFSGCERSGFYAQIRRWHESNSVITTITTPQSSHMTPSSLSSNSATASQSTGGATLSSEASSCMLSDKQKQINRRVEYLQANSTGWVDVEKTGEAMSKRKKRTMTQVVHDEFNKKLNKFHYEN